jgi:hypothetical protein
MQQVGDFSRQEHLIGKTETPILQETSFLDGSSTCTKSAIVSRFR